jgi:hypothetical protein
MRPGDRRRKTEAGTRHRETVARRHGDTKQGKKLMKTGTKEINIERETRRQKGYLEVRRQHR